MSFKIFIKNLFKTEPFTVSALEFTGLINVCQLNENKSAYIIELNQSGINATITIPIDIYELFIDLEFKDDHITSWDDFYGQTKVEDYKQKLVEISELVFDNKTELIIRNKNIFICKNGKVSYWF